MTSELNRDIAPSPPPDLPKLFESGPGRRCTVCDHPKLDQINAAIAQPKPNVAQIARDFTVHVDAVHRHRKKCVPIKLNSVQIQAVVEAKAESDRQFVKLAVTDREHRIERMQAVEAKLSKVLEMPEFEKPVELQRIARGFQVVHKQVALETGEHLAQQGKSAYGAAQVHDTPIVLVVSAAAALPTSFRSQEAAPARHIIRDGHTRKTLSAPDDTATSGIQVPLSMVDIEQDMEELVSEDTREQSLSGVTRGGSSAAPAPPSAVKD